MFRKTLLTLAVAFALAGCITAFRSQPKYAWRGHMLDTCRHFFTVEEIKKTLDLMHEHELNVFHWHLTDNEGWRLQIDRYPKLVEVGSVRTARSKRTTTMGLDVVDGAYGPYFYTKDDVREIVRYAAARGIEVVPEIEIPGHESASIRAYPELGCTGRWNCGEFCLGKEDAFIFMCNVLDEVMELFPGKVIHIGGDECSARNWKVCKDCQKRIRDLGLKDEHALQGWATKRFAEYLESKGRRLMGWDELASWDDLPRSVIVQSYRGASYGVMAAKKGFDVVMSPDIYCYLDYVQGLEDDPEEYQPFGVRLDVATIARFDPCAGVPEACRRHILGGEGNLWTELVPDWKGVEWRVWPRLAALADVLQNGPAEDLPAFMARMESVRADLVRRGVNAAPLGPLFKPRPDLLPGAHYVAFKADNGARMDFAKMLANPLDMSVLRFDLKDRSDPYRHVFAKRDPSLPAGSYRLDMNWDGISMSAPDDTGFQRGLDQMKALARPKRGGTLEFSGAVIAGGLSAPTSDPIRVATYNILLQLDEPDSPQDWMGRRADLLSFLRDLKLDVFGLQEVCPDQLAYLRAGMKDFAFVGEHRNADRVSGEASPVAYRKDRFTCEKSGTFWLSERPEEPGSKSWGTACTRVCSYAILKDRRSGKRFCFANTHTDHVSAEAREKGMLLIIRRMQEFGKGLPIVFTGDHNCSENEAPAQSVGKLLDNALYACETAPKGGWRTWNGWRIRPSEVSAGEALGRTVFERNGGPGTDFYRRCGGPRIDYIYVSPGTRVTDYETFDAMRPSVRQYPSDHFPVAATVFLP